MKHDSIDALTERAEQRAQRRARKRKADLRMKVSGKSVHELQRLIIAKGKAAQRKRRKTS